jgi:hypothetical protein
MNSRLDIKNEDYYFNELKTIPHPDFNQDKFVADELEDNSYLNINPSNQDTDGNFNFQNFDFFSVAIAHNKY